MQERDLQAAVQAYVEAFDTRDLPRCIDFFAEDATLTWLMGSYRGKQAIEKWHKDRFAANLRIVRLEEVRFQGNAVIIDVIVSSDRLKTWRMDPLSGRATYLFQEGKIKDARFSLRGANPLDGWS